MGLYRGESGFKYVAKDYRIVDTEKVLEKKAITIYDIAKEAGVSAATVSRVLTNSANVRREKKEKVQQLIEKYNFKPNVLAKGLSDARSKIIGIIAADVRNLYYAEMFVACEEAAKEAGYTVLISDSLSIMEREIAQLEMMAAQKVDAVIQLGGRVDDLVSRKEYVEKVKQLTTTIPLVTSGKLDGADCYRVCIDEGEAFEKVMNHLVELGHKEIALVGGLKEVTSTYEKYQQYLKSLEKYQLEFREEYFVEGKYDNSAGYQGMNRLFEGGRVPTAVIAVNDFTAAGVMQSIVEHGYRIPEDISVVSYDNTYITDLLTPKLTSVDYNYEDFGRKLVATAIGAVEGRDVPKLQYVTPTLKVRESSGRVPDNRL